LLRFFLLLLILAGGALGIGYPWAVANLADSGIGKWRVYERDAGFAPAEAALTPSQAPVLLSVELVTRGPLARGDRDPVLTVTADTHGKTVIAQTLDFEDVQPSVTNPQTGQQLYTARFARIEAVEGGRYVFTFGPGVSAEDQLVSADLVLESGASALDPRAVPAGYVLMALGLVGFIASFRRARRENPNSSPPPRWGRG
jgi:hypothetical protein